MGMNLDPEPCATALGGPNSHTPGHTAFAWPGPRRPKVRWQKFLVMGVLRQPLPTAQPRRTYTTGSNFKSKQHGIRMAEEDVPTLVSVDKPAKPLGMRKNGTAPVRLSAL